ncbi:hypothetical protein IscW_ISCW002778, partial [Ixodes scapularis]
PGTCTYRWKRRRSSGSGPKRWSYVKPDDGESLHAAPSRCGSRAVGEEAAALPPSAL